MVVDTSALLAVFFAEVKHRDDVRVGSQASHGLRLTLHAHA